MGILDSLKKKSSSFQPTTHLSEVEPTSYSSRYSSAPTSRCTSPIGRTRSNELSSIISRSIIYPTPTPLSSETNRSVRGYLEINSFGIGTQSKDEEAKINKTVPEGFKAFLEEVKMKNPNYREKSLDILKPISTDDKFDIFMRRKRNSFIDK
ncbi:uncharacterized protein I206_104717 [Kwoniella pini CBS 10737]|uniref:Uncharacterized protein n=1 Tax=Kwoniella pini CBS 10737 TaxID=1296096 RepID=A0A1B9I7Y2_9TREE|nr:uncharacterized protein I206_02255 [Kwoniella pini CBS 10737]OCF51541.1 hypothetical protein I206_02255 [Kwoniella pini CBS 10737]